MEYFVWPLIRSGVGGQKSEVPRDSPIYVLPPQYGDVVSVTPCLLESSSLGLVGASIFGVGQSKCSSKAIMSCEYEKIHAVPNMKMYILLHRKYANYVQYWLYPPFGLISAINSCNTRNIDFLDLKDRVETRQYESLVASFAHDHFLSSSCSYQLYQSVHKLH